MFWWISIVFYLWQNSFRRWVEQPLSFLSKLVIACLIGILGAIMIVATGFLGDELNKQLADRDAKIFSVVETVSRDLAPSSLSLDDPEDIGWSDLSDELLILYRAAGNAKVKGRNQTSIYAVASPEDYGYLDTLNYLSKNVKRGAAVEFTFKDSRLEATAAPMHELIARVSRDQPVILASVERLSPLLHQGFGKIVIGRAKSTDDIQKAHDVAEMLRRVDERKIYAQSGLSLLKQIEQIRDLQSYVLLFATIGSSLILGLITGALAWMEFREERYLLSLIRSFGVGRTILLAHAVFENCLMSVLGVLMGFGILFIFRSQVDISLLKLQWLSSLDILTEEEGLWLVLGATFGGLLSCVPIGIGLRKPLGLVLK